VNEIVENFKRRSGLNVLSANEDIRTGYFNGIPILEFLFDMTEKLNS